MYLAMYKNGSSSLGLGTVEGFSVVEDGSEAIAVDELVECEEGCGVSLGVEEPMDEQRPELELDELGEEGWSVKSELEEEQGLDVG